MAEFITLQQVKYEYPSSQEEVNEELRAFALDGISMSVHQGEFVCILGRNGSGKSTLARMLNALLIPTDGVCIVSGLDSSQEENHWEIRKQCGMVFQNPDNQIIGTSVEEDVAFGLENIGVPTPEIRKRIDESMRKVGIFDRRESSPHLLSGGQKQRVAIAGILAMQPSCIVLDEATAMLDPIGRKEVLTVVQQLNRELGMTVLLITHHMDEAVLADRILVVDEGAVVMEGTPKEIFSQVEKVKALGLDVPQMTELIMKLKIAGLPVPDTVLTVEEAYAVLAPLLCTKEVD